MYIINFPNLKKKENSFLWLAMITEKKRSLIYHVFLSHMTDEEKFQMQAKLVNEVLNSVVEGVIKIDDAKDIILDTLDILSSKSIKINFNQNGDEQDVEDIDNEEQIEAQRLVTEATGRIFSKLQKKNVIENIVPIIIELKHLLEKKSLSTPSKLNELY